MTNNELRLRFEGPLRNLAAAILLSALASILPVQAQTQNAADAARLEANKKVVIDFYKALFDDRKVAEAFAKYAAPDYIQHSPLAADVPSTIDFLQKMLDGMPKHDWELVRVIAEGDLVVLHVHSWSVAEDPGRAIVEIFRVADGRVAEHWEVIQTVVKMEGRSMF
jgi:predicted SnoaL-like aldol condensation-catalyzing enzyme